MYGLVHVPETYILKRCLNLYLLMNNYTYVQYSIGRPEACLPVVCRYKAVAWVHTKHADVSMIPLFFLQRSHV